MNSPPSSKAASGIIGLDEILLGGFPRNRLYLVQGNPGSGKTTLGLQFLLQGLQQGEPGLYVTLSETREELVAVAQSHGWSLEGLAVHELTAVEEQFDPEAQYTLFQPSEVELGETTQKVLEQVERAQAVRVVLDSLSEMRLLARDPLRYRRQILAFKQFFVGRQCTVLLLDDGTAQDSDLQLQSLAHGVVMLEHLASEYGAERRRLRVIKMRGVPFHGGYHDFTITTGGLVVHPRLIAAGHKRSFDRERITSGVDGLDQMLGGGLDRGTSTLFLGPAGCGKTTLALQYLVTAASRGEQAVLCSFDENRHTILARGAGIGLPLVDHVERGLIKLEQIDPAELSPGELACRMVDHVRSGARVVAIDSLNGYMNAMPGERNLTIQLHELLTYLNQHGVVSLLIEAQHGLIGHMQAPVDVSYLADTVVLLRYFEAAGRVRQAISVLKKRCGSHERTIRQFQITGSGIHLGPPLAEFHGVLLGTPTYVGKQNPLLIDDDEAAAE